MSWRLFKNTIVQPGKNYTLQTIPTLSTAMDFDVRKNQPDFNKMLEKRMAQAQIADEACANYKEAYGYSDYDIAQLDPDNYSDEIMDLIYSTLNPDAIKNAIQNQANNQQNSPSDEELEEIYDYMFGNKSQKTSDFMADVEDNTEQAAATAAMQAQVKDDEVPRYAGKHISRDMIVSKTGVNHGLDATIIRIYKEIREQMNNDSEYFQIINGNLCGLNGQVYIKNMTNTDNIEALNEAARDENSRVFAEGDMNSSDANAIGSFVVTDAFLHFLVSFPKAWPFANGDFELRMKNEIEGN